MELEMKYKQETLEESAKEYLFEVYQKQFVVKTNDIQFGVLKGFEAGAKWQQERMYSEADRIMKFLDTEKELKLSDAKTIERIKWYFETYFEQFKKK